MDDKIWTKLTYGLFVLSVKCYVKDNACIVNTAVQVASNPNRIAISVNKQNHTDEMLHYTDDFTLSVISEDASFSLFQRFGFASGRDSEKFDGFEEKCVRVENGTYAVKEGTNGYISAHIDERIDLGSHTLYIATVTAGETFSAVPSASYAYYHANIKPKPQAIEKKDGNDRKTVWRCKVCGYEYEGEELPDDYVCPICKHGKEDFERI